MSSSGDPPMPAGPLHDMHAGGQSVWLRGVRRRLVQSGRLAELMSTAAVSGLTVDLTALCGAVERGAEYDAVLREIADADAGGASVALLLAQEAAIAADALLPLYEESGRRDGMVCVPIDPSLANDAEALARAARRFLGDVARPNIMAELPPTDAGFAVFETLVADGLYACVGPVFTIASALRATEAFLSGTAGGQDAGDAAAALVFGVASVDGLVDQLLHREIRAGGRDMSGVESLLGGAGVAVAKVAWRRQRDLLAAREASAAPLRIAWTDLSAADPRQPREHYVERLVGPDTIAVLNGALVGDLMRRGDISPTLGQRVDEAEELLADLSDLGIDVEKIGAALEAKALRQTRVLHAALEQGLATAAGARAAAPAKALARAVSGSPWSAATVEIADGLAACDRIVESRAVARLWDRDGSLWGDDEASKELVANRLGWLDLDATLAAAEEPLLAFAAELEVAEIESIVLLGMGGSSLAAEVCRSVFDSRRLHVLDSTVPASIKAVAEQVDPARTAVVVASKSGSTIEVRALLDWFYALATPMLDRPGERFTAITDPGTPLEQLAHERAFGRLWLAPADVGGRFSALTVFGTLPMALMGIDVDAVMRAARRMAAACAPEVLATANPAARLAAALHDAWQAGRDKVTLVIAPPLAAFAQWVEQLLAESTGKRGRGLVPVVAEPAVAADAYAEDRLFVSLALAGQEDADHHARLESIDSAGHPLLRFELADVHDLGGEFFRWEAAVALLGALMDINPFDQPDVQASKERTEALLAAGSSGAAPDTPPLDADAGWAVFADLERDAELARRHHGEGLASWMAAHLGRAAPPQYVAIQAFLQPTAASRRALDGIRRRVLESLGVATTLGWGPAFLHSTGQLHKGGPDTGLFLQITADNPEDIEVPGADYSFGRLLAAQALGDLGALQERGRRVLRVHLRDAAGGCDTLLQAVEAGIG